MSKLPTATSGGLCPGATNPKVGIRAVWHAYRCPTSNIARRDHIRMTSESAGYAHKRSLGLAIGFINATASRTGARRVSRIDKVDRNTSQRGLVRNKGAKLKESPAMEYGTLRPSSPNPRANVREVFKRNRPLRAFGLCHDPFTDSVIRPCGESSFLSCQPVQPTTTAFCSESLQRLAQPAMSVAHVLDPFAGVYFASAVCRNVCHAQVYTQHAFHVDRRGRLNLAHSKQVPCAVHQRQICLASLQEEQLALPITTDERNSLPPVKSPDRDVRFGQRKRQDTVIVSNRTVQAKGTLNRAIQLVRIRHFCNTSYDHLCGKPKRLAGVLVHQFVYSKLSKGLRLPGNTADGVARLVCPFQCSLQSIGLFRRRLQLQLYAEFHIMSIPQSERLCKHALQRAEAGAFLPPLEAGGFPTRKGKQL